MISEVAPVTCKSKSKHRLNWQVLCAESTRLRRQASASGLVAFSIGICHHSKPRWTMVHRLILPT